MKQDRAITAMGVLAAIMGVLMITTGRYIMGGIILLLSFGIFWNRGGGRFNDRSVYEQIVKTDLNIERIYEKIKDIDTPLGKPWLAEHKGYDGKSIVFGPGSFRDCVVISRAPKYIDVKHITKLENIIRSEEDEYRFADIAETEGVEVSPGRYAVFAAFDICSAMMVRHLAEMIQDLSDDPDADVPPEIDFFKFYYHNSSDGSFRDSEGNAVLRVEASYSPFVSKVLDADGNEMASAMPRSFNKKGMVNDLAGYELFADGEHYAEIKRFRENGKEGFVCDTPEGEFRAVIFPSCLRANVSCNYTIEHDGKLMAVIGGSPNLIFENEGRQRSDLVLSYDDDYLVLYAILEVFIITLNSGFLK